MFSPIADTAQYPVSFTSGHVSTACIYRLWASQEQHSVVKNPPAMQEALRFDPWIGKILEEDMAAHWILTLENPQWTERKPWRATVHGRKK